MKTKFGSKTYLILLIGLFTFAIFINLSYACTPQFYEHLNVRVLTNQNYPIPNASVNVQYQYIYGMPLRSVTHTTNEEGIASFDIMNSEKMQSRLNCNIYITANFMGSTAKTTIVPVYHSHPVDLKIDAYKLTIYPVDQNNNYIPNTTIVVDGKNVPEKYHKFYTIVTKGQHTVTMIYNGRKTSRAVYITNNTVMSMQFSKYTLTLSVIDDYGRPVSDAEVYVNGMLQKQTNNGTYVISNLPSSTVSVKVIYKGKTYSKTYDLLTYSFYKFAIDTIPPKIENLTYHMDGKNIVFNARITDDQDYATGIDNVKVRYSLDNDLSGKYASVFVKTKDIYGFEIQNPGPNHNIILIIFANDGADNYAQKTYSVKVSQKIINLNSNNVNNTNGKNNIKNNKKNSNNNGIFSTLSSWILPAVGLIILVIGLYYLYKWKKGADIE